MRDDSARDETIAERGRDHWAEKPESVPLPRKRRDPNAGYPGGEYVAPEPVSQWDENSCCTTCSHPREQHSEIGGCQFVVPGRMCMCAVGRGAA